MADPGPGAFAIERAEVRDGVELAYVREGVGGYPLLLVHGWPETMRIWWRNIGPLAEAGFEVIVPDLRGFGESSLAPDGFYDLAAHARDLHALVTELVRYKAASPFGRGQPYSAFCNAVRHETSLPLTRDLIERVGIKVIVTVGRESTRHLGGALVPELQSANVTAVHGHVYPADNGRMVVPALHTNNRGGPRRGVLVEGLRKALSLLQH